MTRPVGNSLIPPETPLHVSQLAMAMLKATFAEFATFTYTQDIHTTGVVFDTTFNKESKVAGVKPAIVVNRGGVGSQQLATGDVASMSTRTMHSNRTGFIRSSIEVKVIAKNSQEVDIVSHHVYGTFHICRPFLNRVLGVHQIHDINLSPISPYDQDDRLYYCAISVPFSMQINWTWIVPETILNSIDFYMNDEQKFLISAV